MDVRQNRAAINSTQAHDGYWNLVRSCFLEPNCTGILVWGIRDSDSWIPGASGSSIALSLVGDGNPGTDVNIGSETYTIRARGIVGGEQIQLQINGVVKATLRSQMPCKTIRFLPILVRQEQFTSIMCILRWKMLTW